MLNEVRADSAAAVARIHGEVIEESAPTIVTGQECPHDGGIHHRDLAEGGVAIKKSEERGRFIGGVQAHPGRAPPEGDRGCDVLGAESAELDSIHTSVTVAHAVGASAGARVGRADRSR